MAPRTKTLPDTLPLDAITIGAGGLANVRTDLGDVTELAASIEAVGLLNPLTVTAPNGNPAEVLLVAGHRRLEALKTLGWDEAPVRWVTTPELAANVAAAQLVENLQREDLDPLDEAAGIARLVDLVGSQRKAAAAIGRSPAHISKRLRLAKLPEEAREAIAAGTIPLDAAYELTQLPADAVPGLVADFKTNPDQGRWGIQRAAARIDRDRQDRDAAKALAPEFPDVEVIARPDVPPTWRTLEGWDGIAVDQDAHEAEPCHRIVAEARPYAADGVGAVYYCAEPHRHDADGDSELKTMRTRREDELEKRRQEHLDALEARRQARAELNRTIVETVAGISDRNAVIKALSLASLAHRDVLGHANAAVDTVARGIGIELPPVPDGSEDAETATAYFDAIEAITRGEGISVANLYRLALGVALYADQFTGDRLNTARAAIGIHTPEEDPQP